MILEAAGLAVLAALSPTALLVAAVYLGSARPRVTALMYLTGAVFMSLLTGVILLFVLRAASLNRPSEHAPRYGFRVGLGALLLIAAAVVWARKRRRLPEAQAQSTGLVSRMVASPGPVSAFLTGLLIFAPGVTFLAAVQVIATSRADPEQTTLALIIVCGINVMLVWIPIVLHSLAPEATGRRLTAFNAWLRANGSLVLLGVLLVVGAIFLIDGIHGLVAFG